MRHFIGGAALGFFVAIIAIERSFDTSWGDYLASCIAHMFIAVLFGVMAWGLLP